MKELFKTGLITVFFDLSNYQMSALAYLALVIGAIIQMLILQKSQSVRGRYIYPVLLMSACIVCEILTWAVIAWERFYASIVYLVMIGELMGVILATIVYRFKRHDL